MYKFTTRACFKSSLREMGNSGKDHFFSNTFILPLVPDLLMSTMIRTFSRPCFIYTMQAIFLVRLAGPTRSCQVKKCSAQPRVTMRSSSYGAFSPASSNEHKRAVVSCCAIPVMDDCDGLGGLCSRCELIRSRQDSCALDLFADADGKAMFNPVRQHRGVRVFAPDSTLLSAVRTGSPSVSAQFQTHA